MPDTTARRLSPSTSSITRAMLPSHRLDAIDRSDVRMVQRGQDFRFALEPGESLRVTGQLTAGSTLIATARFRVVSMAR